MNEPHRTMLAHAVDWDRLLKSVDSQGRLVLPPEEPKPRKRASSVYTNALFTPEGEQALPGVNAPAPGFLSQSSTPSAKAIPSLPLRSTMAPRPPPSSGKADQGAVSGLLHRAPGRATVTSGMPLDLASAVASQYRSQRSGVSFSAAAAAASGEEQGGEGGRSLTGQHLAAAQQFDLSTAASLPQPPLDSASASGPVGAGSWTPPLLPPRQPLARKPSSERQERPAASGKLSIDLATAVATGYRSQLSDLQSARTSSSTVEIPELGQPPQVPPAATAAHPVRRHVAKGEDIIVLSSDEERSSPPAAPSTSGATAKVLPQQAALGRPSASGLSAVGALPPRGQAPRSTSGKARATPSAPDLASAVLTQLRTQKTGVDRASPAGPITSIDLSTELAQVPSKQASERLGEIMALDPGPVSKARAAPAVVAAGRRILAGESRLGEGGPASSSEPNPARSKAGLLSPAGGLAGLPQRQPSRGTQGAAGSRPLDLAAAVATGYRTSKSGTLASLPSSSQVRTPRSAVDEGSSADHLEPLSPRLAGGLGIGALPPAIWQFKASSPSIASFGTSFDGSGPLEQIPEVPGQHRRGLAGSSSPNAGAVGPPRMPHKG